METDKKTKDRFEALLTIELGICVAIAFSVIFEPSILFVLYRVFTYTLFILPSGLFIILVFFFVYLIARSRTESSQKILWELFFGGVSITSFALAGMNFFTSPYALFSVGAGWLMEEFDVVLGGVHLSVTYFVVKTLWGILIGSFFALLTCILVILARKTK